MRALNGICIQSGVVSNGSAQQSLPTTVKTGQAARVK